MKNKIGRSEFIDVLTTVLLVLLLCLVIIRMVFSVAYIKVYVVGSSMSGTIEGAKSADEEGGEYVYAFKSCNPRRGDIVVINTADKKIIKRVIALGNDRVELKKGVLYINGQEKSESYVLREHNNPNDAYNTFAEITVPDGYMFCMGDNRDVSVDSRSETYGCMPVSWTAGIVADWSMSLKGIVTKINTFVDFRVLAR